MGRVKERLQYLSYLKALEMTYRGVYVDYSEYEWMVYAVVQIVFNSKFIVDN